MTTILIENAVTLSILGSCYLSCKRPVVALLLIMMLGFYWFEWFAFTSYKPTQSPDGYTIYYWLMSIFYLLNGLLFYALYTKLSLWVGFALLTHSAISLAMCLNGATIQGVSFPYYELVYVIHQSFTNFMWMFECVIAVIAVPSSRSENEWY